jgi:4-nitrophenyl phosphatase
LDAIKIRALILDMDGVLWRGDQPIGNLPAIFNRIKSLGWRAVLATNNATRSPEQAREKIHSFGVELEPWQVVNSGQATAHFLKQTFPDGGPVYVIGEAALIQTLEEEGFYTGEDKPLAVIVGLDRQLTYEKIQKASNLIRSGLPFFGTNPDNTLPTPEGLVPGAGAVLAAVAAASGTSPKIMGKPQPEIYRAALQRLGTSPEETLVVGDRLETDIKGGQALGCRTALVLSGVSGKEDLEAWAPLPDLVAANLEGIIDLLEVGWQE